jgi:arginyl-tRNA synthetase
MAAEAENLDARMEAIRLKNEELEKKHKEIMEDEQNAKRENAIVNLKQDKSDIPKEHPYDKLDLDFDVKDTEKELAKNPDSAKTSELSHHARKLRVNFICT